MPTLMDILRANSGQTGAYKPPTGVGSAAAPAGTNGYDFGSGSDVGDFYRNIAEGNQGLYSNTTKNALGVGGTNWDPAAASAGYLASQGGPDNAIGFNAWMSGNPQYTAAFGAPPPAGTTFDQFRQGIGKSGPDSYRNDPTLYHPPPGAPGAPGTPPPAGTTPPPAGTDPGTKTGYPLDIASFLDPGMKFRMDQGQQTIGTNAAAMGNYQSGSTLKGLEDFSQGMASQEWANAYQRAAQQQGFKYNVDTGDRDFAYKAMTGDRDYNTQVNEFMAQLGLQGAQGASGYQQNFANAIANLMSNQGQIAGQGTAAGSAATTNAITQVIQGLQSGMTLQQIMAKFPNLGST